jgi:hypothetical protein
MEIDLDTLIVVVELEAARRGLEFHGGEVAGAESDLEEVILVAARRFARRPDTLEPRRRELVTPGRFRIDQLATFLAALPGDDDTSID